MTVEEEKGVVFDEIISSLNLAEQDASSFLTDSSLLEKTFKSLLQLASMDDEDCGGEYEEMMEALELKFTEKLDELVVAGVVEEDDYVDILGEDDDSEESEFEEDSLDSESEEDEESEEEVHSSKPIQSKSKKLSSKNELEMLMAPVGDGEDEEDDDEDFEDEDQESFEPFDNSADKMDMFNENDDEESGSGNFSSFERAQVALRDQIASLEDENVQSERPWALRGEITARQRPSDSLLEEVVEFEHTSRPVPQVTEERTEAIEDVIKRRITEAAWDDVERKDGRDLTLLNGMAAPVKGPRKLLEDVATAQPQRSLTQVYEDDLKTKLTGETAGDAESKEKRAELTSLFAKICRHIDGLSGNRFAPKVYAHSEIQIKTLGSKK